MAARGYSFFRGKFGLGGTGVFTIFLSSKNYSKYDTLSSNATFTDVYDNEATGIGYYPLDQQLYAQAGISYLEAQAGQYSVPIVADIEGTGIPDFIAFDPLTSVFFITPNPYNDVKGPGYLEVCLQFGQGTFYGGRPVPVVGNFDGGNQMELAVYEPSTSTFSILQNAFSVFKDGFSWVEQAYARPFGPATPSSAAQPIPYVPVIADYDGDGVADLGIFASATATFYVQGSAPGAPLMTQQFGPPGQSVPLVGDYTGVRHAGYSIFVPTSATFAFFLPGGGANIRQFGPAPVSVPLCGVTAPARATSH